MLVSEFFPEQLALGSARAGNGNVIMRNLDDAPRLVDNYGPGRWVKMQNVARGENGNVTVHWFRNVDTGANVEFKFTQRYFGHMRPSGVAKSPTGNGP